MAEPTGDIRHHTDAGLTGDKVNAADPAAAPMDTDAEVAGTPTPRAANLAALKEQLAAAWRGPKPDTFGALRQPGLKYQSDLGRMLFGWVAALVLIGLFAGWLSWP